jgi:hypothetical protein
MCRVRSIQSGKRGKVKNRLVACKTAAAAEGRLWRIYGEREKREKERERLRERKRERLRERDRERDRERERGRGRKASEYMSDSGLDRIDIQRQACCICDSNPKRRKQCISVS